jgi:two-component system aerobic respiration control sensor histidine kinase ArcB
MQQWGYVQLGLLVVAIIVFIASTAAYAIGLLIYKIVAWQLILGAAVCAALVAAALTFLNFYLIHHLNSTLVFLKDSASQEKKLNKNLQDKIRQLNFEIEERKKAFQAKRRAIDELRKEIVERIKTQRELEDQSLLLRSIVDTSPDLFYYRDETGRFAGCNKMFETLIGKPIDEIIGRYPAEIYDAEMAPTAILTDNEVSVSQAELTLDVEYRAPDGVRMWFEMRKVPFFDRHGRYIGLLGFGRDISSRKRAELALERAYHDKGKFIATLSHELRTPLNGIVGLTRRIIESELSVEQRSWANTIFSSAETLGNIFNDIIDLDKIDRQDLDIVLQDIDIEQFISDIANFAGLICQQKGLQFVLNVSTPLRGYYRLDPTRVRQVLWNLLNNAVKFTARGTVSLVVSAAVPTVGTAATVAQILEFKIVDTGIGIAAHEQDRIFDMYYKSSDGRRLSIVGSGIGLSVSKALVEAMGGRIHLQSVVNQGSVFSVTIPSQPTSAPQQLPPMQCRSLMILLVEDVPLNAEIAINLLEQRGHSVLHAETGEDALALLETEDAFDLVLLDMQLPDMNGDEIARFMREDERFSQIPIVVLSANVRKAEQQLQGVRIDAALAKPINTRNLDDVLGQLFLSSCPLALSSLATNGQRTDAVMIDVAPDNTSGDLCLANTYAPVVSGATITPSQATAPAVSQHDAGPATAQVAGMTSVLDEFTLNDYLDTLGYVSIKRSVQLFKQLLPGYINKMVDTAMQQQNQEFSEAAHKLKGAASSVGLRWVTQQAKHYEHLDLSTVNCLERQLIDFHLTIDRHIEQLEHYIERFAPT